MPESHFTVLPLALQGTPSVPCLITFMTSFRVPVPHDTLHDPVASQLPYSHGTGHGCSIHGTVCSRDSLHRASSTNFCRVWRTVPPPHVTLHTPESDHPLYEHIGSHSLSWQGALVVSAGQGFPAPTGSTMTSHVVTITPGPHGCEQGALRHLPTSQSTAHGAVAQSVVLVRGSLQCMVAGSPSGHPVHSTPREAVILPPPQAAVHGVSIHGEYLHTGVHGTVQGSVTVSSVGQAFPPPDAGFVMVSFLMISPVPHLALQFPVAT